MKLKILLIDDDMALCRLLKNNLEQEGYDVCVCHDGVTGLQEQRNFNYHLVILDIMLPLKNGYEVLEKIRGRFSPRGRSIGPSGMTNMPLTTIISWSISAG